jgi:hypothetical protein
VVGGSVEVARRALMAVLLLVVVVLVVGGGGGGLRTIIGCVYLINGRQADSGNAAVVVIPCKRLARSEMVLAQTFIARCCASSALKVLDAAGHALPIG